MKRKPWLKPWLKWAALALAVAAGVATIVSAPRHFRSPTPPEPARKRIYQYIFNQRHMEEARRQPYAHLQGYIQRKLDAIAEEFDDVPLDELIRYGQREVGYDPATEVLTPEAAKRLGEGPTDPGGSPDSPTAP